MTSTPYARFREVVETGPDRTAVRSPSGAWSYRELDRAALAIAGKIVPLGGGAPLALAARPGAAALACMLAALRTGRIVSPVDADGLELALNLLDGAVVIADEAHLTAARAVAARTGIEVVELGRLARAAGDTDAVDAASMREGASALVHFTSGSRGRPKGVELSHRSILSAALTYGESLGLDPNDRVAWLQPLSSGASTTVALGALLHGAELVVLDVARGLSELVGTLHSERITVLHVVPSLFRLVAAELQARPRLEHLRVVKLGGEPAYATDLALFQRSFPPRTRLVNGLGMTEAAGNVCVFEADHATRLPPDAGPFLPIGRPVQGTFLTLVDDEGHASEPGAIGRIAVRSPQLALGYWRDPERTRAAFSGEGDQRTFFSMDVGRQVDGALLHLGRADDVIKVGGQTISTAEVEAAIASVPGVRESAVIAEPVHGGLRVIGVLVADGPDPRPAVRERLPRGMAAAVTLTIVEALPRLSSGKVDREALVARVALPSPASTGDDLVSATLREIWSEALGVRAGDDEDFFALGGHSLAAAEIIASTKRRLGVELPVTALFLNPTIARMAAAVRERGHQEASSSVVPLRGGPGRPIFMIAGKGSEVMILRELAGLLDERPVYGLQLESLRDGTLRYSAIEEMASDLLEGVRRVQPRGPYQLLGKSFGGRVVFEMARQLRSAGEEVTFLALVDTYGPGYLHYGRGQGPRARLLGLFHALVSRPGAAVPKSLREVPRLLGTGVLDRVRRASTALRLRLGWSGGSPDRHLAAVVISDRASRLCTHEPPVDVRVDLFRSAVQPPPAVAHSWPELGWAGKALRGTAVHQIAGTHRDALRQPAVRDLARRLDDVMREREDAERVDGARETWDGLADFWDAAVGDGGSPAARLLGPAVESRLGPLRGTRVLDVGCGNGWFTNRLAEAGATILGVDFSRRLIAHAEKHRREGAATFRVVDATRAEELASLSSYGPFDAVVSTMALMDIDPIEPLLEGLSALVRPEARFVFSMLDARGVGLADDGQPESRSITALPGQPAPHLVTFRPEAWLRSAFARAGWDLGITDRLPLPEGPRPPWILDAGSAFLIGVATRHA